MVLSAYKFNIVVGVTLNLHRLFSYGDALLCVKSKNFKLLKLETRCTIMVFQNYPMHGL